MQHSGCPSGNNAVRDRGTNVGNRFPTPIVCLCACVCVWFCHCVWWTVLELDSSYTWLVLPATLLLSIHCWYHCTLRYYIMRETQRGRGRQNEVEMAQCPQIKPNNKPHKCCFTVLEHFAITYFYWMSVPSKRHAMQARQDKILANVSDLSFD